MPPVHPNLMAICNLCVNKKLLRGTSGDKKNRERVPATHVLRFTSPGPSSQMEKPQIGLESVYLNTDSVYQDNTFI